MCRMRFSKRKINVNKNNENKKKNESNKIFKVLDIYNISFTLNRRQNIRRIGRNHKP